MSVTDEELLRLARKAWHDKTLSVEFADDGTVYLHEVDPQRGYLLDTLLIIEGFDRARQALHAALLVLAGELDIEAVGGALKLSFEGDLRDRLDRALATSERDRAARGRAVNTTQQLTSLCERAIAGLERAGHGDVASMLSEQLRAALKERA